MSSPTQRSLKFLRDRGWTVKIVERWNQWAKKRDDLWAADLIAIKAGVSYPLLVQCTSATNVTARQHKVEETPEVKIWLTFGAFLVQGWKKTPGCRHWESISRYAYLDNGKVRWEQL